MADNPLDPTIHDGYHALLVKENLWLKSLGGTLGEPDPLDPGHDDNDVRLLVKNNLRLKAMGAASVPPPVAAAGIGMGYAYFGLTPILANGNYQLLNTIPDAGGTYGNTALFNAVPNGVEVKEPLIVSVMLWAKDSIPQLTTARHLAVQLDKQKGGIDPSQVLLRVPTGFIWGTATAVYQGILLAGDIVRGVAMAPVAGDPFSVIDGYASVLGVPISV